MIVEHRNYGNERGRKVPSQGAEWKGPRLAGEGGVRSTNKKLQHYLLLETFCFSAIADVHGHEPYFVAFHLISTSYPCRIEASQAKCCPTSTYVRHLNNLGISRIRLTSVYVAFEYAGSLTGASVDECKCLLRLENVAVLTDSSVKLIFSFLLSYPLAGLLKRIPDAKPYQKNIFIIAHVKATECQWS